MRGSATAGRRAGTNGGHRHEHRGRAPHPGAAPISPPAQHTASNQHEHSPSVTSSRHRMARSCPVHKHQRSAEGIGYHAHEAGFPDTARHRPARVPED